MMPGLLIRWLMRTALKPTDVRTAVKQTTMAVVLWREMMEGSNPDDIGPQWAVSFVKRASMQSTGAGDVSSLLMLSIATETMKYILVNCFRLDF